MAWTTVANVALLDHRTEEIATAFDLAGVDFLVLKGPAVRNYLYDEDERRALHRHRRVGESRQPSSGGSRLSPTGLREAFWGADPREQEFYGAEWALGAVIVDLHSTYPGLAVDPATAWAILASHRVDVALRERSIPILDAGGVALIVALHAGKSVSRNGRDDRDLRRCVERLDRAVWQQAVELARQLGAAGALRAGIELASPTLAADLGLTEQIPTAFQLELDGARPVAHGLAGLAQTDGVWNKIGLIGRKVVPTPDGLRYWSPAGPPRPNRPGSGLRVPPLLAAGQVARGDGGVAARSAPATPSPR